MIQRTLAIIKPDAFKKRLVGRILQRIEDEGFQISALKLIRLTQDEAKAFYAVHKDKRFYGELTEFMSSGPVVAMVLEAEEAIGRWREVMGATDPSQAKPGTLRRIYGFSIERNAVHGSDGIETAETEVAFFFPRS
jgi:nucleoside-diphosphate kinase